ncbi:MAG: hypothetical protein ACYC3X_08455 [Pirellulaceae bacterium]
MRCGDLDPGIALRFLADACGDKSAVEKQLNNQSGVLGLSGSSADIRDAFESVAGTSVASRAHTTIQVYLWRLKKYLGAYLALAGTVQAVIFTDTIGETVPEVREAVCSARYETSFSRSVSGLLTSSVSACYLAANSFRGRCSPRTTY